MKWDQFLLYSGQATTVSCNLFYKVKYCVHTNLLLINWGIVRLISIKPWRKINLKSDFRFTLLGHLYCISYTNSVINFQIFGSQIKKLIIKSNTIFNKYNVKTAVGVSWHAIVDFLCKQQQGDMWLMYISVYHATI